MSDKPANKIVSSNRLSLTDAQKLKNLAKVHKIPLNEIRDAINAFKLVGHDEKKVIKHFSKILNTKGTSDKVLRKYIVDQTRRVVDPVGLLKDYVKNKTEIRWRTIQNALDTGMSPRRILRDLKTNARNALTGKTPLNIMQGGEIDFTGEHKYAEDLQKEFKQKNAVRRARDKFVKSTGNKIVKTDNLSNRGSLRMFKAISEGVPKKEADAARRRLIKKSQKARMKTGHMRHWVPDYSSGKPKEPRLQKMSKSARNAQKLQIKQLLKQLPKPSSPQKISNLSRLGSGVSQLGAGIALNALTDKFVKPHTDELGRRAGIKLKKFVDRLEEKNAKKKKEK